jgi:hypothetical protein
MFRGALKIAALSALLATPVRAVDFEESIAAREGGTLRVDLDAGSIEIESHDEPEVRVEASASRGWGSLDFRLTGDGTDTRLVGEAEGFFGWILGGPRIRVRVRVPPRYSLEVRTGGGSIEIEDVEGEVRASTSGGRIELKEVAGSADVRTSGGSIEAEEIEGDLSADTSGGAIRVAETTGRVEVHTSGGELEILDVRGPVSAETSGGSIALRFTGAPEGTVETSGGGIEVEFPEGAGVELDARTSGGRVEVEQGMHVRGSVDSQSVRGEINGGGPKLRLRTSGGNIRVRAR